ncbi:MAG TPA: DUF3035 domain-containing protein [Alphaproteobacteria bacterium]|nr:DUF3035 domain-containing protein [Alphaproteobacteria bacterium]
MTDRPTLRLAALAAALLVLSGCGSVRQSLGLEKTVPDEFAVVSRPPLSMPPDYSLRPPRPGASGPGQPAARDVAAATVFGSARAPNAPVAIGTAGESTLLGLAGAGRADPNIRTTIDREATQLAVADTTIVDSIIFWRKPPPAGDVVDPAAEAARIRANQAQGKPVTEGTTPVIVRKRRAPLEGLFN